DWGGGNRAGAPGGPAVPGSLNSALQRVPRRAPHIRRDAAGEDGLQPAGRASLRSTASAATGGRAACSATAGTTATATAGTRARLNQSIEFKGGGSTFGWGLFLFRPPSLLQARELPRGAPREDLHHPPMRASCRRLGLG